MVEIPKQTSVLVLEVLPETEQSMKLSKGLSALGAKNMMTIPKMTQIIENTT